MNPEWDTEPDRRRVSDRRDDDRGGRRNSDKRDPIAVQVAWRLGREMRRRRMSVRGLAIRASLDDRTVRRVLDARNTGLSTLAALADALQMPLARVISGVSVESAADVSENMS